MRQPLPMRLHVGGSCHHPEIVFRAGGGLRAMEFPNSYAVLQHPRHGAVLFDTGYSAHFFHATRHMPFALYRHMLPVTVAHEHTAQACLARQGIEASKVKFIIISHFHADHIAALRDFPQARFICTEHAYADVQHRRGLRALARLFVPGLLPHDFAARLQLLRASDQVPSPFAGSGFELCWDVFQDGTVLATDLPGHANGQLGLWLQRPDGQRFFLVADAVWLRESFENFAHPRPMLRRLMHNRARDMHTIGRLHDFAQAHEDVAIVPSHCPRSLQRWAEKL